MGSSPQNFLPSTCSPSWLSFHCALPNNFLWLSSPHLLPHSLTLLPTLLLGLLVPNLTGMQRKRVMQTEWFEDNTPILIPTISGSRLLIQRTPRDSTWTPLTFLLPMWTPRPWPQRSLRRAPQLSAARAQHEALFGHLAQINSQA